MNRTAPVLGATIVALALSTGPAAAEDRAMPTPKPQPTGSASPFPGVKHGATPPPAPTVLAATGPEAAVGLGGLVLLVAGVGLVAVGRRGYGG